MPGRALVETLIDAKVDVILAVCCDVTRLSFSCCCDALFSTITLLHTNITDNIKYKPFFCEFFNVGRNVGVGHFCCRWCARARHSRPTLPPLSVCASTVMAAPGLAR